MSGVLRDVLEHQRETSYRYGAVDTLRVIVGRYRQEGLTEVSLDELERLADQLDTELAPR